MCNFFIPGEVRFGESSQQRDFVRQGHRGQRGLGGAGVHRQEQETHQPLQRNIGGQCSFFRMIHMILLRVFHPHQYIFAKKGLFTTKQTLTKTSLNQAHSVALLSKNPAQNTVVQYYDP